MKRWEYLDIEKSKIVAAILKPKIVELDGNIVKCSEYCGINRTTFGNKLNGHNPFRVMEVEKVCDYLGIDYNSVFNPSVTAKKDKKQDNTNSFTLLDEIVCKVGTAILDLCGKPDISYVDVDVLQKLLSAYTNFIKEIGGNKNE